MCPNIMGNFFFQIPLEKLRIVFSLSGTYSTGTQGRRLRSGKGEVRVSEGNKLWGATVAHKYISRKNAGYGNI
jgi:hypothetical protein